MQLRKKKSAWLERLFCGKKKKELHYVVLFFYAVPLNLASFYECLNKCNVIVRVCVCTCDPRLSKARMSLYTRTDTHTHKHTRARHFFFFFVLSLFFFFLSLWEGKQSCRETARTLYVAVKLNKSTRRGRRRRHFHLRHRCCCCCWWDVLPTPAKAPRREAHQAEH